MLMLTRGHHEPRPLLGSGSFPALSAGGTSVSRPRLPRLEPPAFSAGTVAASPLKHGPEGAVDLLTLISKGCSSHCVEDSENYYVGKKNVTCCSTDLCNASGAPALQPAIVTLTPLTVLGVLLFWGPGQL
eukprot:bmy_19691T0